MQTDLLSEIMQTDLLRFQIKLVNICKKQKMKLKTEISLKLNNLIS